MGLTKRGLLKKSRRKTALKLHKNIQKAVIKYNESAKRDKTFDDRIFHLKPWKKGH